MNQEITPRSLDSYKCITLFMQLIQLNVNIVLKSYGFADISEMWRQSKSIFI